MGWHEKGGIPGSTLEAGSTLELSTTDQRGRGCGWVFHIQVGGVNGGDTIFQEGGLSTEGEAKRAAESWLRQFCITALASIGESA